MIYGLLNQGSGAGNQLFRYIALRIKALDLDVDYRLIWNPDNSGKPAGFKCKDFMQFDESKIIYEMPHGIKEWYEKKITDSNGVDIRGFDPEYFFVGDNTLIEGELQDSRYWEHREAEVSTWLTVEPLAMPDDVCVIGFRGGEFALYPDLFLEKEYWDEAIAMMKAINPTMKFEVHTDDPKLAWEWLMPNIADLLPNLKVIHDIGINWRSMRYAKYAIIANSSFFILPRWLRDGEKHAEPFDLGEAQHKLNNSALEMRKNSLTIAPRYWARHNVKTWSLSSNYYKRFTYI